MFPRFPGCREGECLHPPVTARYAVGTTFYDEEVRVPQDEVQRLHPRSAVDDPHQWEAFVRRDDEPGEEAGLVRLAVKWECWRCGESVSGKAETRERFGTSSLEQVIAASDHARSLLRGLLLELAAREVHSACGEVVAVKQVMSD